MIFGITGDLAKKMTFRSLYRLERRKKLDCPIIGVARNEWSAATLRDNARHAIEDSGERVDEEVFERFAERLSMVAGDYTDPKTYDRLARAIEGRHVPVFYLEIPPSLFGRVVEGLAGANLTANARVVVEKPFGHDLASARALNAELRKLLDESQILRIDHFLGKEPAMDILFLRFANSIFEPLWNRDRIQCVQVTMAEDFGVEDRGSFYDPVGALRDVVQNHLLQLIGLFASEPPVTVDADGLRDKRFEVFKSMPSADPAPLRPGPVRRVPVGARGQARLADRDLLRTAARDRQLALVGRPVLHPGREVTGGTGDRDEDRVQAGRPTLPSPHTSSPIPTSSYCGSTPTPAPTWSCKPRSPGPQTTRTVDLSLIFSEELGDLPEPYERLLGDALQGDSSLFTREDSVEETWRIVQPLLDAPPPVETYAPRVVGPGRRRQVAGRLPRIGASRGCIRTPCAEAVGGSGCGKRNWARSDAKIAGDRDHFDLPHPKAPKFRLDT